MSKQSFSLVLHTNYRQTCIALFCTNNLHDTLILNNQEASKLFFTSLNSLLEKNDIKLTELLYIGVHVGPGPFTTLRTVLTCANGLAFATNLPLIEVDGLTSFAIEQSDRQFEYTIALLNAYCDDLYYAIHNNLTGAMETGCLKTAAVLEKINMLQAQSIKAVGNGWKNIPDTSAYSFAAPLPETVSLETIGAQAWQQWLDQKNITTQVLPLYLKTSF